MIDFFKAAIKAAKEKKYKMDFTVMQQVVKDPMPVKIPKEQKKKKKSLLKTPIEYAPPRE